MSNLHSCDTGPGSFLPHPPTDAGGRPRRRYGHHHSGKKQVVARYLYWSCSRRRRLAGAQGMTEGVHSARHVDGPASAHDDATQAAAASEDLRGAAAAAHARAPAVARRL